MDDWVNKRNIAHFEKLLREAIDPREREGLEKLLVEAQNGLLAGSSPKRRT